MGVTGNQSTTTAPRPARAARRRLHGIRVSPTIPPRWRLLFELAASSSPQLPLESDRFPMTDPHDFTRRLQKDNGSKIVFLVGDGLGGLPLTPGGKTELETAQRDSIPSLKSGYGLISVPSKIFFGSSGRVIEKCR